MVKFFIIVLISFYFSLSVSAAPLEVTNDEKLSLSADTEVGTVVKVTDGFGIAGSPTSEDNGFYVPALTTTNGKIDYKNAENTRYIRWDGSSWYLEFTYDDGEYRFTNSAPYPWEGTWENGSAIGPISISYPAYQELTAPSEELTAVFISGAGAVEVNGIYTERGTSNAKPYYNLLGQADMPTANSVQWNGTNWELTSGGEDIVYQSMDNVAFPWLITTWEEVNSAGVPTANISITQGELDAGVTVEGAGTSEVNGTFPANGNGNGFVAYPNIYGGIYGDANSQDIIDSGGGDARYQTNSAFAFPWEGTYVLGLDDPGVLPAPTVSRNDVASEANWILSDYEEPEPEPEVEEEEAQTTHRSGGLSARGRAARANTPSAPAISPEEGCKGDDVFNIATGEKCSTPLFTRDLAVGSQGEDVRALQVYLNAQGFLVAEAGPGSPGQETTMFGALTRAAVIRFQIANGIVPSVGYVGIITRGYIFAK